MNLTIQSKKRDINEIIGKCLGEIKEKTGIMLNAKVNGRTVSLYLDDPEDLYIPNLDVVEKAVLAVVKDESIKDRSVNILKTKLRKRDCVDARSIFTHICRQHKFQFAKIGKYLKRHHTSIIHLDRRAKDLLETDRNFEIRYKQVVDLLKEKYGKAVY